MSPSSAGVWRRKKCNLPLYCRLLYAVYCIVPNLEVLFSREIRAGAVAEDK